MGESDGVLTVHNDDASLVEVTALALATIGPNALCGIVHCFEAVLRCPHSSWFELNTKSK